MNSCEKLAILVTTLYFFTPALGATQSVNFSTGGVPVKITADNGIEWQQNNLVFIARGNAEAVRKNLKVNADELRAYYQKLPKGTTEIWRLDAIKKVRFTTSHSTIDGDNAVYDFRSKVLVITGKNLRLVSGEDSLTARDQIELWQEKQMAVARGKAIAMREDKKVSASILAAYFRKSNPNGTKIYRVDAFDNVLITTNKDTAEADRGVYNVDSGVATLSGQVKITRQNNVIRGCSAEVNLNTGVSHLYRCPRGQKRVNGVLSRQKKTN